MKIIFYQLITYDNRIFEFTIEVNKEATQNAIFAHIVDITDLHNIRTITILNP